MDNIKYEDVIARIGFFRTKANLSLRDTSMRLGYNPQFMTTIENKSIELKVKTLLDFCDVVGISVQDFFYLGKEYNEEDKNLLEIYGNLSKENKKFAIDFIKKLK